MNIMVYNVHHISSTEIIKYSIYCPRIDFSCFSDLMTVWLWYFRFLWYWNFRLHSSCMWCCEVW